MALDAFEKEYGKLVGKKVVGTCKTPPEDGQEVYGLLFDDGTVAWVLQDPEGNGPGFLEIEKVKLTKAEKASLAKANRAEQAAQAQKQKEIWEETKRELDRPS